MILLRDIGFFATGLVLLGLSDGPVAAGVYADYKAAHFGSDITRRAAPWADANGDGVPNLVEFALGRDPVGPNLAPPWSLEMAVSPGGERTVAFRYARDESAQVELLAEWTRDLVAGPWSAGNVVPLDTDRATFFRLRATAPSAAPNTKGAGYRGIWYTLGQYSNFGYKYSGGLGTYTSSHTPIAIHAPEVNKTFFTYGGTPAEDKRQLQIMAGVYDHATGLVSRPTMVYSRNLVDDPHDNASLAIDEEGHVWLFVSGRGTVREGRIFRSEHPYSIERFTSLVQDEFTYPQPWWFEGEGFLHLFTKYVGTGRLLFWNTSRNGGAWGEDRPLAAIGGHYQTSGRRGGRVGTAFNRHPGGSADRRTDLYYMQTDDRGGSWTTAAGGVLATPVTTANSPARVRDYSAEGRLVYMQDLTFDGQGRPAILYLTSEHHQPGPGGDPRRWEIAHWQGAETGWVFREVTTSTHNYDVGFLHIEDDGVWRVFGPTGAGPQPWGTGGEIAIWESHDAGATWAKVRDVTAGSVRNHGYSRHPLGAHPDFYAFWADGNTDQISRSYLYFSNRDGDRVFRLPYDMNSAYAAPELMPPVTGPVPTPPFSP